MEEEKDSVVLVSGTHTQPTVQKTKKKEKMNKQECGLKLKGAREERDCGG